MLVDSRLKPELVARKAPPAPASGEPVKHEPRENVFIVTDLPGVTPMPAGEDEVAAMMVGLNLRSAVALPCRMTARYDKGELVNADIMGTLIPAALAHARKNLVAPKTASLELLDAETVTPDNAAFPRYFPGSDSWGSEEQPDKDDPLAPKLPIGPSFNEQSRERISNLFLDLGPSEPTEAITFCPYALLNLAKAMGVKDGDGVTVILRGPVGRMSVLPLRSEACNPGEALGILQPFHPNPTESDEVGK